MLVRDRGGKGESNIGNIGSNYPAGIYLFKVVKETPER